MNKKLLSVVAMLLLAAALLSCSACSGGGDGGYSFLNMLRPPDFVMTVTGGEDPVEPSQTVGEKLIQASAQNSDVVGWLVMPGIGVDHPVVQSSNNEYYLRKGLDKQYNYLGILYADYECSMGDRTKLSRNTIVYGHNVDDDRKAGKMFAQMINYDKADFAAANQFITYVSPDDEMTWVVFAAFYCESSLAYIYPEQTDKEFTDLITEVLKRSSIKTDVQVTKDDKILTLSTCTYQFGSRKDQRFVVMARLLRPGERQSDFAAPTQVQNPKAPNFSNT